MKFTNKSRYGIKAMIDMAVNYSSKPVSVCKLAERNDISTQYLEQVFASLRRAKLVKSIKGPQGGYLLNRPARDISVADVIEALEGNYLLEVQVGEALEGIDQTIQNHLIRRINEELEDLLMGMTLADMGKLYQEDVQNEVSMYYI